MNSKAIEVFNMFNKLRKLDYLNNERLKSNGLNNLETLVLLNLSCEEDISQKDLVVKFKAPKQTVNTIVMQLADKNLIDFKKDPKDKRSKLLLLTDEGISEVARIKDPLNKSNLKIYEDLGEAKINQISSDLSDLIECLEKNI